MTDNRLNLLYEKICRIYDFPVDETDRLWFCSDWADETDRSDTRRIYDFLNSREGWEGGYDLCDMDGERLTYEEVHEWHKRCGHSIVHSESMNETDPFLPFPVIPA